jgi:uncharacterized membrane protein
MTHFDGTATKSNRVHPWKPAGKCVFASLFLIAGVGHFVSTEFFVKIMPPYLPYHRELVLFSGVIEIALGVLLLIPTTSGLAAWGLVALLIAVFPANLHVYQHQELFPAFPYSTTLHLLRLPLQGVLILWALAYTRSEHPAHQGIDGDQTG